MEKREPNSEPDNSSTQTPRAISEPAKIGHVLAGIESRMIGGDSESLRDAEAKARERIKTQLKIWDGVVTAIGRRYVECSLENFETMGDHRKVEAMKTLNSLVSRIDQHVNGGGNVVLYGPPGTGKDHLLMALMRVAARNLFTVEWHNGQDLYGDFRDRIGSDRSEEGSLRKYGQPHVLAISDPVPPKGVASDYAATMLYRIVDRRYRNLKSTWITMNVAGRNEALAELTAPVFDRLLDNCVSVFCNWPSYRAARRPQGGNSC